MAGTSGLGDCFAAPDRLLPLDEALDLLAARLHAVTAIETLPTVDCLGRVLAEDVVAGIDVPAYRNAAMDGYAVRHADLASGRPTQLPIEGRAAAGHPLAGEPPPRSAVRIFTGAAVPEGFDTVVMQEDCVVEETHGEAFVTIPAGVRAGMNVRPAGEDVTSGRVVLHGGRRLRPQDIAMAAGIGLVDLPVRERLRVMVFSTGDEVRQPGTLLPYGHLYDSNRPGLMAACATLGCAVTDGGNLPDRPEVLRSALHEAAQRHDLILTSGGVSVGGEDHVRAVVQELGSLAFWKVNLRPGKPTAMGAIGQAAFLGLPGNPVSGLVTFILLARVAILRLSGAHREPLFPRRFMVKAGFSHAKSHDRREFLRARLEDGPDGPVARLYHTQMSSVLSSLVDCDGLVDMPADASRIEEGRMVPFIPFAEGFR